MDNICPNCKRDYCPTQYDSTPRKETLDATPPELRGVEWYEDYMSHDMAAEDCQRAQAAAR